MKRHGDSLNPRFCVKALMSLFDKPSEYESDLGPYTELMVDSSCGETISWGFRILRHLGERFNALGKHGKLQCLQTGSWALVTKQLTHEEAIEKYGPVTARPTGPQGGWRSITYGTTRFLSRLEGC